MLLLVGECMPDLPMINFSSGNNNNWEAVISSIMIIQKISILGPSIFNSRYSWVIGVQHL